MIVNKTKTKQVSFYEDLIESIRIQKQSFLEDLSELSQMTFIKDEEGSENQRQNEIKVIEEEFDIK